MATSNSDEQKPPETPLPDPSSLFLGQAGLVNYSFGVDAQNYLYASLATTVMIAVPEKGSNVDAQSDVGTLNADYGCAASPPLNSVDASLSSAPSENTTLISSTLAKYHGFSEYFDFESCLKRIFFKIDGNHDNRLSKNELYAAIRSGKFNDDEEVLAGLILEQFDSIRRQKLSSSTFFDERGVNLVEIVTFPWGNLLPPNCR